MLFNSLPKVCNLSNPCVIHIGIVYYTYAYALVHAHIHLHPGRHAQVLRHDDHIMNIIIYITYSINCTAGYA